MVAVERPTEHPSYVIQNLRLYVSKSKLYRYPSQLRREQRLPVNALHLRMPCINMVCHGLALNETAHHLRNKLFDIACTEEFHAPDYLTLKDVDSLYDTILAICLSDQPFS